MNPYTELYQEPFKLWQLMVNQFAITGVKLTLDVDKPKEEQFLVEVIT